MKHHCENGARVTKFTIKGKKIKPPKWNGEYANFKVNWFTQNKHLLANTFSSKQVTEKTL